MRWMLFLAATALAMGWVGAARPLPGPGPTLGGAGPAPAGESPAGGGDLRSDPRVQAFLQAYGPLIEAVSFPGDDVVFTAGGRAIHFQDGRMLGGAHLDEAERFDPFFYTYPLDRLREPPAPGESPAQSTDVLEALFGRTESEIRRHCRSVTFLDRRLFLNTLSIGPLQAVEREILAAAAADPAVARWMADLEIAYSFKDKDVAGSGHRSYHAWGLAVDLVPRSYGGKHVYWRWSRVFHREDWHRIPLDRRWSPPAAVVEAFERHGFVWGGKWAHFDTIHFEYRPEILLYNRMIEG